MVKFSTAAKLTQARYGTSRQPAIFERRKKATVVAAITSHRITISTKAQPGWCIPKKIQDQETFRASWTPNSVIGTAACLNQDGSINGPDNPAEPEEVLTCFGTGGGPTDPPCDSCDLASTAELQRSIATFAISVGGRSVTPLFCGKSPGLTCGLDQWNFPAVVGETEGDPATEPVIWVSRGGDSVPFGLAIANQ